MRPRRPVWPADDEAGAADGEWEELDLARAGGPGARARWLGARKSGGDFDARRRCQENAAHNACQSSVQEFDVVNGSPTAYGRCAWRMSWADLIEARRVCRRRAPGAAFPERPFARTAVASWRLRSKAAQRKVKRGKWVTARCGGGAQTSVPRTHPPCRPNYPGVSIRFHVALKCLSRN